MIAIALVRFALVNFQSPDAAKAAVDALHLNLGSVSHAGGRLKDNRPIK